jgi:photosystem II stability/assembly factor-like uncharacterized protein
MIYAGTWKCGLFISDDDGKSWKKDINFHSGDVRSIKAGIQTPLLVYASTSAFGVVKSIDGGKTWKRNEALLVDSTFQFAWSIEVDPKDDSIVYAQTIDKGVWRSIDQGETWSQLLKTLTKPVGILNYQPILENCG